MRSFGTDGIAGRLALVAAEVVKDDEFAPCQGRRQHLFDIEREEFAIDGAINDPGGADPVVTQRCDEGHGLPMAEALPARSPAAQRRHVGFDPGLVDKYQARSVNPALMLLPAG